MPDPQCERSDDSGPVASLTINRFDSAWPGLWRIGSDSFALRRVPGLRFFRLLGTGRGDDLTLGADLRRWARFAVWSSWADLTRFEAGSWRQREREGARTSGTLVLRPTRWHGRWGGVEPFGPPGTSVADASSPLAVLTRASLRPTRLPAFWKTVPASQQGLGQMDGLLYSLGLGEVPLLHQATFSLWRDVTSMQDFAHRHAGHRSALRRTRTEGWYREELFARFAVLDVQGTWGGHDPLSRR